MKKRNSFMIKLASVTLMLGLFSPSVTIEKSNIPSNTLSETKSGLSEELFAKWEGLDLSVTLFAQAEARSRRSSRHSNYRHRHGGHHGHYRRHHRRNVAGAAVAGAVVGAAVTSAAYNRSNCQIVYMNGYRYRDCGNGLYRY